MAKMTIGQLAQKCNVKTDTIRYYETLKLIEPVSKTNSGYRLYDNSSAHRLSFIQQSKSLGFTLSEIQFLFTLQESDHSTAKDMLKLIQNKISDAEKNIEDLISMKKTLESLASECPGGNLPLTDCPITFFLQKDRLSKGE